MSGLKHDLSRQLDRIESKLDRIAREMKIMSQELDQLETQVKANTDAEQSAIELLNGLSALIEAGKTDPAKLTKLATDLKTRADALAAAIVANTPTAPHGPNPQPGTNPPQGGTGPKPQPVPPVPNPQPVNPGPNPQARHKS